MENKIVGLNPSTRLALLVGIGCVAIGYTAYYIYRRPYREIKKYYHEGRIEKPRKWRRILKKRNRKKLRNKL
ncbi:MAG: hypothetical protein V4547_17640 [Bacteroidota bacterium]